MAHTKDSALALALSTWPDWEVPLKKEPSVIKMLTGGLTNRTFLLDAGGCMLVLRMGTAESGSLGIDRAREQGVLRVIADSGLAPSLIYCHQQTGQLVTEYVAGQHWPIKELGNSDRLERLVNLLQQLHRVEGDYPNFDYAAHIEHYYQNLLSYGLVDDSILASHQSAKAGVEYLSLMYKGESRVLCHHDLGPLNLLESDDGKLVLLDWEYAGGGWPVIDQVALLRQWKLPASAFQVSADELSAASSIWDFIDQAWYRLNSL